MRYGVTFSSFGMASRKNDSLTVSAGRSGALQSRTCAPGSNPCHPDTGGEKVCVSCVCVHPLKSGWAGRSRIGVPAHALRPQSEAYSRDGPRSLLRGYGFQFENWSRKCVPATYTTCVRSGYQNEGPKICAPSLLIFDSRKGFPRRLEGHKETLIKEGKNKLTHLGEVAPRERREAHSESWRKSSSCRSEFRGHRRV